MHWNSQQRKHKKKQSIITCKTPQNRLIPSHLYPPHLLPSHYRWYARLKLQCRIVTRRVQLSRAKLLTWTEMGHASWEQCCGVRIKTRLAASGRGHGAGPPRHSWPKGFALTSWNLLLGASRDWFRDWLRARAGFGFRVRKRRLDPQQVGLVKAGCVNTGTDQHFQGWSGCRVEWALQIFRLRILLFYCSEGGEPFILFITHASLNWPPECRRTSSSGFEFCGSIPWMRN